MVSSSYAIGGARFAIRSTSSAFGGWLRDVLGPHEVEDVEDFLYSVVVPGSRAERRRKEFCVLYKGSTAIARSLDPVELGRSLLAELEALRFHERDDAVYLTAAALAIHGAPALTPPGFVPALGRLGRRLEKLGARLPGQMTVAVDVETARVVPPGPSLGLAPDALARLGELFATAERDGLFFLETPSEFGAILVPSREPEAPFRPTGQAYALANLSSAVLNFEKVGGPGLRALAGFVERTPCFEMAWRDPGDALKELSKALGGAGAST